MVCDYYIERFMNVYYKDGSHIKFELDFIRGWFPDLCVREYDTDEEPDQDYLTEYDATVKKIEQLCLRPKLPRTIYIEGEYVSERMKEKYDDIVRQKVQNMENVERILLEEIRYEPHLYFEVHPNEV